MISATNVNPNNDLLLQQQPEDTVSGLQWNPTQQYFLAASMWDGKVAAWQIGTDGRNELKGFQAHGAPALDVCWDLSGGRIFSAGGDKKGMMWDLNSNNWTQVAAHDEPLKVIKYSQTVGGELLMTGGWDGMLKYWDCRASQPIGTVNLNSPVHCADFRDNLGVVCTNNRGIFIYDLKSSLDQPFRSMESPLKYQTRCVAAYPDCTGYALGSIEGRVALQSVMADADPQLSFTFKCHRSQASQTSVPVTVHSVNTISFHGAQTFSTAGSDGSIVFWNKQSKSRLSELKILPSPIIHSAFSPDSALFAYAIGYDWHKGFEYYDAKKNPNGLLIHANQADEFVAKKK